MVLYSQEDWSALAQFFVSCRVPCTVRPKFKRLYFGIAQGGQECRQELQIFEGEIPKETME